MLFIVGHTFEFKHRSRIQTTGSLQEQLALKNKPVSNTSRSSSIFDERFIQGNVYRLSKIQKIVDENKQTKVLYLFSNNSNASQPDIDLIFNDTSAGDDCVAAMSGAHLQLQEQRKTLISSYENNSDL